LVIGRRLGLLLSPVFGDVLREDSFDFLFVFVDRLARRRAGGKFGGGIEQPTATETVVIAIHGVGDISIKDGEYFLCRACGLLLSGAVEAQPFLVAVVDIGID